MATRTPPPRKQVQFDEERREAFLELVRAEGLFAAPQAIAIGVSPRTYRRHVQNDPEFAEAVQDARVAFLAKLVTEARRRAIDGVDEEYVGAGGKILKRKRFSDALMALLLKSRHGLGTFTDRVEVEASGTIKHEGAIHPDDMTDTQRRHVRALLREVPVVERN